MVGEKYNMLKHSKWRGQDPRKVIRTKQFKDWLIRKVQKAAKKLPQVGGITIPI